MNDIFKLSDPWVTEIGGYPLGWDWWSRYYEYPWALKFAHPSAVVADMGCGYMQRPFKDVLARVCKYVYAVDVGAELLAQAPHDNMQFVVADFTRRIEAIPEGCLDVVFCISVLEELGSALGDALKEFHRCLRPGGLCVITCDVKFDKDKPLGQLGAVDLEQLELAIKLSGLEARDRFNYNTANALYHVTFNLCVFRCVLVKP